MEAKKGKNKEPISPERFDAVKKRVSANLQTIREDMHWSQAAMAQASEIAESTLSNYLKGEQLASLSYLIDLCSIPEVQARYPDITVAGLLSSDFKKPVDVKKSSGGVPRGEDPLAYRDFFGNYAVSFYEEGEYGKDPLGSASRELRSGVVTVYPEYNAESGTGLVRAKAVFVRPSDRDKAEELRSSLNAVFETTGTEALSRAIGEAYQGKGDRVYDGSVSFTDEHIFLTLSNERYSDRAHIILHHRKKREKDYIGGLGCVASVSRNGNPIAQSIILSKNPILCDAEETAELLNTVPPPKDFEEEARELVRLCRRLCEERKENGTLRDEDISAILEKRLLRSVREYAEREYGSLFFITKTKDKKVFRALECTDAES